MLFCLPSLPSVEKSQSLLTHGFSLAATYRPCPPSAHAHRPPEGRFDPGLDGHHIPSQPEGWMVRGVRMGRKPGRPVSTEQRLGRGFKETRGLIL